MMEDKEENRMMQGKAYLPDLEKVVRNVRKYGMQRSPIYVAVNKYNILYIDGIPICEMIVVDGK